jgi:uncharacterized protein YbjT (DUF2867 family)
VTAAPTSSEHGPGHGRIVSVLGGTGFFGHRVVRHLLDRGFGVRAAARHPERMPPLLGSERLGTEAIQAGLSLYVERGGREIFRAVHVEAAARIARLAREAGVGRLIHVSGIGADPAPPSDYIRARGEGEIVVHEAFPGATLVRPSVMSGPDDYFLTTLVRLLQTLPVYPLFGRGRTRLQPVHVADVAEAIARILGYAADVGRACYEFGGPRSYTYAELLRSVAGRIGARAWLLPQPIALWQAVALLSGFVPGAAHAQPGCAYAARQRCVPRPARAAGPARSADSARGRRAHCRGPEHRGAALTRRSRRRRGDDRRPIRAPEK